MESKYGWVTPENPFEMGSKPTKCMDGKVNPIIENVHLLYEKQGEVEVKD